MITLLHCVQLNLGRWRGGPFSFLRNDSPPTREPFVNVAATITNFLRCNLVVRQPARASPKSQSAGFYGEQLGGLMMGKIIMNCVERRLVVVRRANAILFLIHPGALITPGAAMIIETGISQVWLRCPYFLGLPHPRRFIARTLARRSKVFKSALQCRSFSASRFTLARFTSRSFRAASKIANPGLSGCHW